MAGRMLPMAGFTARLYQQKAVQAYHGYVRREPLARLGTPGGRVDPYPIYERLRTRGPLSPTRLGNWVSPSYSLCNRVLRERRFGVWPEDAPSGEQGLSFLEMNPPDHTRLRRLVAPAFSPRRMAGYRPLIEKRVHELLDAVPPDEPFDLVGAFSAPLPIAVISELLGVPHERADDFARYGATIGSALDGVKSLRHARALMQANAELERLFEHLFALRRAEPADDLVSAVVAAGDQVRPGELVPLCTLLLIAGFETTVNLISNGTLALLEHREQWQALRDDPSLAPAAVEEVLRYDPPVQRTGRLALQDMELEGRTVRRNQVVLALLGAAGRDPDVYADPNRFDITRQQPVEHLAFSSGIHYCLGQPLARLEGAIAFAALAERLPHLRRAGRVVHRDSATIRGPLRAPLRAS